MVAQDKSLILDGMQHQGLIQTQEHGSLREKHTGSIDVEFDGMPSIQLESYAGGKNSSVWERLSIATRRRKFTLKDDWEVELGDIGYEADLNGKVVIPAKDENNHYNIFDGASIPVPWLISLLTIGILRPLGIVLVGSIIHDYAYSHGKLRVLTDDGQSAEIKLERHKADKLFRDIIGTVNRLPLVGYIAWLAVRIGWLWVPYNGQRFTGRIPYSEYAFVICAVGILVILESALDSGIERNWLLLIFGVFYLVFYLGTLLLQRRYK